MKSIQVVLDERLLKEADREARRTKVNRSALIREALREHLRRRKLAQDEDQERRAYREQPLADGDVAVWQKEQVWPED